MYGVLPISGVFYLITPTMSNLPIWKV